MMNEYTRSDLACESAGIGLGEKLPEEVYREETIGTFTVSRLAIRDEAYEAILGKPQGNYVTLVCGKIWLMGCDEMNALVALLAREIRDMCVSVTGKQVDRSFRVLVAGLGNSDITPDAIGPFSVRRLNVTRHLRGVDEALYDTVGRCEISAVFPGVLGQTGIETVEMIRGAVENAKPDMVLAVDALAARSCERLAATVQLSDNGISPGSGIGNERKAICRNTVGVPVVALGVPTVVNSSTLVYDALRRAGIDEISGALREVLENGRSFFVSPKESDTIVERISAMIADAVDMAFTVQNGKLSSSPFLENTPKREKVF